MKTRYSRQPSLVANKKPVRNITTRSGGIPRGDFPSRKNNRMVGYEQLLEADACVLFEMSPLVISYREQPERIWFAHGDRTRLYTPDYELELADGHRLLVEIKPAARLAEPQIREKFRCIEEHMVRIGRAFTILTDASIRLQPRLSNLRGLLRSAPLVDIDGDAVRRSISMLTGSGTTTFGDMASLIGQDAGVDLLMRGHATCRLDEEITTNTLFTLSSEHRHEWFFIDERSGF
ncbi:TnsA endonuclease N-terminal domain-containing protein [Burkholderia cenocepacia]|uniref:TnsA endonuclease N-terminal domain-containing protein n=1 Tax=Burkholderia cenocepacia TaxID=95486 RepID=UPI00114CF3ED|nr:TnsA endonuclease N-terminal domain-containing protein [Burkholderia cenocepacia]